MTLNNFLNNITFISISFRNPKLNHEIPKLILLSVHLLLHKPLPLTYIFKNQMKVYFMYLYYFSSTISQFIMPMFIISCILNSINYD